MSSVGRLFWKFFFFIWLAQLAGIVGVGAIFWLAHGQPGGDPRRFEAHPSFEHPPPPDFHRPVPAFEPEAMHGRSFDEPPPEGFHIPVLPAIGTVLSSLLCALGLAWYFAKPIRHLRNAFDAAAEGDLDVRVGQSMGGRNDELADLGRDFDHMTERLRALLEGQKNLLHDVSHEMRSPLARLQAAIGLARQQPLRMSDSLGRIEREAERMNLLVAELLTLSRLEAGVVGDFENVEMSELLANIVEDACFEGTARHVQICFLMGEAVELRANAELLHRAIENIVRNALRFSPDNGVVRIEAGLVSGGFRVAVVDQGPGVSSEDLASIFSPFYRGGGATSGGGYGLGLAIAKRVITATNGDVSARNGEAGGLVVEVLFRLS